MAFNLSKPDRRITVGVVLMDSATEILDVAPVDFLNGLSKEFADAVPFLSAYKHQALDIEIFWVNEKGDDARLSSNATVKCSHSFANCPPLDIVLMGAAEGSHVPSETEKAFLRKVHAQCSAFLMICGGFIPAMSAGLLDGKTATAPRFMLDRLRKEHTEVNWVEKRCAHDGKLWTSGALLNGLDLMTAFTRHTWGNELVEYLLQIGSWPVRSIDEYKDGE